jgi:hypothetical protein
LPVVDRCVAGGADDEGFPTSFGHELIPYGLRLPWSLQVGELTDLVDIHRGGLLAQLAPAGLEPGDQLFAADGDRGRDAVGEDRVL